MLFQGPFPACDSEPCYSNGSLASEFQGLMYFRLQRECHLHSEGNQTSLTSLSQTLLWQYRIPLPPTPRLPESLGVFLVISGPLGFQLKPCLLKGFPTSAEPQEKPGSWMCIHRGHPLHLRPQSGGTRHHPHQAWRVGVGGTGRPGTQCCENPKHRSSTAQSELWRKETLGAQSDRM